MANHACSTSVIRSDSAPWGHEVLDDPHDALAAGQVDRGMPLLYQRLDQVRASVSADTWQQFCSTAAMEHPICRILHQDPFTRHSFVKPRGYAGDAALLDLIYGVDDPPCDTTDLGRAIFEWCINREGPRAVRRRRDILAQFIDSDASQWRKDVRILSLACGHLREAQLSQAMRHGDIGYFTALDQDVDSLAEVERQWSHKVHPVHASVRSILTGKSRDSGFHLVYAAGLYDYLNERTATRLTRQLFDLLAPGGRLLIANFSSTLSDISYMESYMGWHLIYRSTAQMADLAREVPKDQVAALTVSPDEETSIFYLEIVRR